MTKQVFLPGRYRHYKGNYYELLFVAKHSESGEELVIYRALYGEGGIWARPAAMWNELISVEGIPQRRFTFVGGGSLPEGLTIRPEREEEYAAIFDLVKDAFSTAAVADGDEQAFVEAIRKSGAYVPELALVAECEGELCGHVMLSRVRLAGRPFEGLLIAAPLCVRLDLRGRGTGGALMAEALKKAREMGFSGAILLGNPNYYRRFGFENAKKFGLAPKQGGVPDEALMFLSLNGRQPAEIKGEIDLEKLY